VKYFEYVAGLRQEEGPDYEYCRKLLGNGLKDLKCSLEGKLDFSGKGSVKRSSSRIKKGAGPSDDNDAQSSDTEPSRKKKGVVACGTQH
jgi:hypothetical protein